MTEFLLDFTCTGTARVEGEDLATVVAAFKDFLNCYDPGILLKQDGMTGGITELSLGMTPAAPWTLKLAEVDGEAAGDDIELDTMMTPVLCDQWDDDDPDCEQVYDEAGGDGYMGLCPHHADISERDEDDGTADDAALARVEGSCYPLDR